jgi:hypothetical protein
MNDPLVRDQSFGDTYMRDEYGRAADPAERQQEAMLGFFDLIEEVSDAKFSG